MADNSVKGREAATASCCRESIGNIPSFSFTVDKVVPLRMVMLTDLGLLVPHPLEAVTLNVPDLAVRE